MIEPQNTPNKTIILPIEVIEENVYIADGQADSTHDGGQRPPTWKLPVITNEEYQVENPYKR